MKYTFYLDKNEMKSILYITGGETEVQADSFMKFYGRFFPKEVQEELKSYDTIEFNLVDKSCTSTL